MDFVKSDLEIILDIQILFVSIFLDVNIDLLGFDGSGYWFKFNVTVFCLKEDYFFLLPAYDEYYFDKGAYFYYYALRSLVLEVSSFSVLV